MNLKISFLISSHNKEKKLDNNALIRRIILTFWNSIQSAYFATDEYSHLSAALLSQTPWVFCPDLCPFGWDKTNNDFILIHNPRAKIPLPKGIFHVQKEFVCDREKGMIIDINEART